MDVNDFVQLEDDDSGDTSDSSDDEVTEYESEDEHLYESYYHEGHKYVAYTHNFYAALQNMGAALDHIKHAFDRPQTSASLRAMIMLAHRLVHVDSPRNLYTGGILCVHPQCQAAIVQLSAQVSALAQQVETEPPTTREHQRTRIMTTWYVLFLVLTFAKAVLPDHDEDAVHLPAMLAALCHGLAPRDNRLLIPDVLVPLFTHTEHNHLERYGNPDGWDEEGDEDGGDAGEEGTMDVEV